MADENEIHQINYDSDNSLEDINSYETNGEGPSQQEEERIEKVREAVKNWKMRALDKSADKKQDPASFNSMNNFLQATFRLLRDILNFIKSAQNNEENMKDHLYVKIIEAIGNPFELSSHERINIEHILNTDLVELPFTVDPDLIDKFVKKQIKTNTKIYNADNRNGDINAQT